jgi:hypothetical protein
MQQDPAPFHVFICNGLVFTLPANTLPPVPQPTDLWTFGQPAWSPGWLSKNYPYMAMVPAMHSLCSPLLRSLAFSKKTAPVKQKPNQLWVLSHSVADKWKHLEWAFARIIKTLNQLGGVNYSLDFSYSPRPSTKRFDMTYPTCNQAVKAIMWICMAFLARVAHISLLIGAQICAERRSWHAHLLENGVPPAWLNNFESSAAATFSTSVPRTGAFILPRLKRETVFMRSLDFLDVPFWLCWAQPINNWSQLVDDSTAALDACKEWVHRKYFPTPEAISAARKHPLGVCIAIDGTITLVADLHNSAPALSDMASSLSSWQLQPLPNPLPSFKAFFAECDEYKKSRWATATPKDKQQWSSWLKAAKKFARPGPCSKTRVYKWAPNNNGALICTQLTKLDIVTLWDNFTNNQMYYDKIHDTWDLCYKLAPQEGPQVGNFEAEGGLEPNEFQPPHTGCSPSPPFLHMPPPPVSFACQVPLLTLLQPEQPLLGWGLPPAVPPSLPMTWNAVSGALAWVHPRQEDLEVLNEYIEDYLYYKLGFVSCSSEYKTANFASDTRGTSPSWSDFK